MDSILLLRKYLAQALRLQTIYLVFFCLLSGAGEAPSFLVSDGLQCLAAKVAASLANVAKYFLVARFSTHVYFEYECV